MTADAPLAVLYEHPRWFRRLFRELERRNLPHARLKPEETTYAVGREGAPHRVVFNRMSPSAYRRGRASDIHYAHRYLAHLEAAGVRVVNGPRAFRLETSKALQLELLHHLGLPYPRTAVARDPARIPAAAHGLRFPVVVKPDVGGSGAGIERFDGPDALAAAAREGRLEAPLDGTLLVQEYVPPAGDAITRVEVLDGEVLYAIRVHLSGEGFDLCPADICRTTDGRALDVDAADGDDAPEKAGLRVEAVDLPERAGRQAVRLVEAAGMDVAGVEYVEDARDGARYYYDLNANSNFVADPETVLGFDPTARLVDFLEALLAADG